MNLTCYIIDDEPHAIRILASYIEKTPGLILAGTETNPLSALMAFRSGEYAAITFLDIDMPELSGLEMAGLIGKETQIIYTTSFRDHAATAYEQDAADYLLKPISYERFLNSCQRVGARIQTTNPPSAGYFFVTSEMKGKMVRVNINEITHITGLDNYVEIHLDKGKIVAYLTLTEILEHLPSDKFSRIQKSVIVGLDYIQGVEHLQVRLNNQTVLPIGRVYQSRFLENIQSLLLISKRKQPNGS